MEIKRELYSNDNWRKFSNKVKHRDGHKCLKCGRNESEVTLQTHHKIYKAGLKPWEYPLSDCITLCKGCHAREHGLIEPDTGWTLISINDLGDLSGICERNGCGQEIRYEHITYHPNWGYKAVGSTCVEYLTKEDQFLSKEVVKIFKKISDFIKNDNWKKGVTRKGISYLFTKYMYHEIRIYEKKNDYSVQVILKDKGINWYDYEHFFLAKNKNLDQVKELGYIVLKGLITEDNSEKEILRNIYKIIK